MRRYVLSRLRMFPFIESAIRFLYFRFFSTPMRSSSEYWETRYGRGGNSGAGSYDCLARFKADVLNDFVRRNHICSVVEFGCGDGAQLALAEYPDYVGIDVSQTALKLCRARFDGDVTKIFIDSPKELDRTFDLALSLDVVYHLVEDHVFRTYLSALFASSHKWVVVYSSDFDNIPVEPHIRHRKFTGWVEENLSAWKLVRKIENRFPFDARKPDSTSFAEFFVYERIHLSSGDAPPNHPGFGLIRPEG